MNRDITLIKKSIKNKLEVLYGDKVVHYVNMKDYYLFEFKNKSTGYLLMMKDDSNAIIQLSCSYRKNYGVWYGSINRKYVIINGDKNTLDIKLRGLITLNKNNFCGISYDTYKYALFGKEGKMFTRFEYESIEKVNVQNSLTQFWDVSENVYIASFVNDNDNIDMFLINTEGKKVSENFSFIHPFRDGVARVENSNGVGYLNIEGKTIFEPSTSIQEIEDFHNNIGRVITNDGKVIEIDYKGEIEVV